MTGYGSAHHQFDHFEIDVEVKTLNSKYADIRLKLPSELSAMEVDIRQSAVKTAVRGKVEITIALNDLRDDHNLCEIDEKVFKAYFAQIDKLTAELNLKGIDPLNAIMKLPGVIKIHQFEVSDHFKQAILSTVGQALQALDEFRQKEGSALYLVLKESIEQILKHQEEIAQLDGDRIEGVKTRLRQNLEQHLKHDQIDPTRFEQELIYYLDKMDIHEEMVRLKQHCEYFLEELALTEMSKGKKLTFISQEIGREINTLGAKAAHSLIQRSVVQMKNELDKIKEQLANVL